MKPPPRNQRRDSPQPLTADTITDEQIRELMVSPGICLRNTCLVALTNIATPEVKRGARERCAEILNARSAK